MKNTSMRLLALQSQTYHRDVAGPAQIIIDPSAHRRWGHRLFCHVATATNISYFLFLVLMRHETQQRLTAGFIHKAVKPHIHTYAQLRVHSTRGVQAERLQVRVPDPGTFAVVPQKIPLVWPGPREQEQRYQFEKSSLRTHGPSGTSRPTDVPDLKLYVRYGGEMGKGPAGGPGARFTVSYVKGRCATAHGSGSRIRGLVYISQRHCRQDWASRWRAGFSLSPPFLPPA